MESKAFQSNVSSLTAAYPHLVCELVSLRVLILNDNILIEIPQEIEALINLRELHLSNCGITAGRVAPAIKSLCHLSILGT